ncbi:MAG: tetratricopeptide repeat protein, partial [Pseudomonadota bacterium]|nr:tetratricopeptide repeat protein [Pseudomonadota bacterium]
RSGHSEDADYHLGLGLMLEQSNDYAEAQKAYERSLELSPSPLASERLGLLASFEGDYKRGSEYLKQAIRG